MGKAGNLAYGGHGILRAPRKFVTSGNEGRCWGSRRVSELRGKGCWGSDERGLLNDYSLSLFLFLHSSTSGTPQAQGCCRHREGRGPDSADSIVIDDRNLSNVEFQSFLK